MSVKRGIVIDTADNVGIVTEETQPGDEVCFGELKVTALDGIKAPHKIALRDLEKGERVIEYGQAIGYATATIRAGQWVHVHNVDAEKMMK